MSVREDIYAFVRESNRIEGIVRDPTVAEYDAHLTLWAAPPTVASLEEFVLTISGASLRRRLGMNVQIVGGQAPPPGGPNIERVLAALLQAIDNQRLDPYDAHVQYETLHPFTDGNGRSGRALWVWMMNEDDRNPFARPFLHTWYYQSLDATRIA